ncbi:conserved hypothetical protein [Alphaproteobacteria bacterium]
MNNTIANCCRKSSFTHHQIIVDWEHIVGLKLAKIAIPFALKIPPSQSANGTLILAISNPGYVMELQMSETTILQKINTYFGYQAISAIKLVINDKAFKLHSINNDSETFQHGANLYGTKHLESNFAQILDGSVAQISDTEVKTAISALRDALFKS